MNIREFHKNHIIYRDGIQGRAYVHGLAILNAKPGSECMKMCGLFGVPMSSAMMKGGPDEDYVSFVSDKDGCSSYWVGSDYEPKKVTKVIYYPDIEEIIDEILSSYDEFNSQLPGAQKETHDANELYKSLGMGVLVEES